MKNNFTADADTTIAEPNPCATFTIGNITVIIHPLTAFLVGILGGVILKSLDDKYDWTRHFRGNR